MYCKTSNNCPAFICTRAQTVGRLLETGVYLTFYGKSAHRVTDIYTKRNTIE